MMILGKKRKSNLGNLRNNFCGPTTSTLNTSSTVIRTLLTKMSRQFQPT